jgi:hypothetical protein
LHIIAFVSISYSSTRIISQETLYPMMGMMP